jgi:hypothetical protein
MSYQIHEYSPDGRLVDEYETLEEVKTAIKSLSDTYFLTIYEIAREIEVQEVVK